MMIMIIIATLADNGMINVYDIIIWYVCIVIWVGGPTTVWTVLGKFRRPLGIGHAPRRAVAPGETRMYNSNNSAGRNTNNFFW